MSMIRSPRHVLAATAVAVLAVAVSLPAAAYGDTELVGPPIGNNKYRTTISPGGDQDDFTGTFVVGDVLDVSVTAVRGPSGSAPSLRPVLVLIDPEGLVVTAGIVPAASGFGASLKGFRIDKSGLWAARIYGSGGTTGAAAVSFRVKPAGKTVVKGQRLGDGAPQVMGHSFAACPGARLDVTVVAARGSSNVELQDLRDGIGADVLDAKGIPVVESAVTKGSRTQLRGVTLSGTAGTYQLHVGAPSGAARYDLTLSVASPKRPSSIRSIALSAAEPQLDAVATPIVAAPGTTVRFTGANFSKRPAPTVLFDGVRGTSVVVGDGGRTLDVVVPPRRGPSVVSVAVVNPDRMGAIRPRYLAFIPPPSCADLVDTWTRVPVRVACATTCKQVSVSGANFEPGYRVLVGGVLATSPQFVSATEMRFSLPVMPQGDYEVSVADPYGRTGSSTFTLFMKTPPSFAAAAYSPGALPADVPTTLTISGAAFAPTDTVWFDGKTVASTYVDSTRRTLDLPALAAGSYSVRFVDSVGATIDGPAVLVKRAPTITAVAVTAGDVLGTSTVPLRGGSTVQIDGSNFLASDTVLLGGKKVTSFVSATSTRKVFVAPAAAPGSADLSITDVAGQNASVSGAVAYAGLADVSSSRAPATTTADSFEAVRGAVADLDGDGSEDDVVLVAPLGIRVGYRSGRTRVLIGDDSGALQDTTASAIPAAFSDPDRVDAWDATCLAIGDLDGWGGTDIVIAGEVAAGSPGAPQVRWFENDGSGNFSLETSYPIPTRGLPEVTGSYYSYYYGYQSVGIYGAVEQRGLPRSVATADIDGDGALDLVVGTDESQTRAVRLDPSYIDFSQSPPAVSSLISVDYTQYLPATRIYANRIGYGEGFVDVSSERLPSAGDSTETSSPPAGLHCRDLLLTDLNNDGAPDLVVTWDDPPTVSAYGLQTRITQGSSSDSARTATRILLNDGSGGFTDDATSSWMPASSAPEYWQADRIVATDLNGDGYPELVLVLKTGLNRYTGNETHGRTALRVLRNDHTYFTDVTSSAIPAVDSATQDDYRGGALAVRDVDGDGKLDIVVGTTDAISGPGGVAAPRTRVLYGRSGLQFVRAPGFAERTAIDTGEADDILFIGDLAGSGSPVMMLVSSKLPAISPATAEYARTQEWMK